MKRVTSSARNKHKSDYKRNKSLEEAIFFCVKKGKWATNETPPTPKTMWKRTEFVFCLIILHLWLTDTANARVDICSSLCRCVNESHFVKIHCDFTDNKVSQRPFLSRPRITHKPTIIRRTKKIAYRQVSATAHPNISLAWLTFPCLLAFSLTIRCNWIELRFICRRWHEKSKRNHRFWLS